MDCTENCQKTTALNDAAGCTPQYEAALSFVGSHETELTCTAQICTAEASAFVSCVAQYCSVKPTPSLCLVK